MGDLRTFVKSIVRSVIKTEYSHVCRPGSVLARVTCAEHREDGIYSYSLKVLDQNGNDDGTAPEVPGVLSDGAYEQGNKVVIQYVDGRYPYIAGRWYE